MPSSLDYSFKILVLFYSLIHPFIHWISIDLVLLGARYVDEYKIWLKEDIDKSEHIMETIPVTVRMWYASE